MKRTVLILGLAILFIAGCDHPSWYYCHDNCDDCYDDCYCDDYYPPPEPYNVYSVTGDECVRIYWNPVYSCDLAGYRIWRGYAETGYYYLVAETPSAYYADWDVYNGETYYYAISSYDIWGNESNLSYDLVFDTPRPEGYGERVYCAEDYPDDAGYDFSEYWIVPYDYPSADVFFGWDDIAGVYYMQAANASTDIMIIGPTYDLNDVDWAPEDGWLSGASVDIFAGYSYLVWTSDNHFAHVRITGFYGTYIIFDWAYQTDYGNPELIAPERDNKFRYIGENKSRSHAVNLVNASNKEL